MPPVAQFAEWRPDAPDLGKYSKTIANAYPRSSGSYGPMKELVEFGSALNGPCKGAGSFRGSSGTIVTFAGTATKLYLWDGTDWDDVTRSGGPYTLGDEHRWTFDQFGDYVYADNGVDAGQFWLIGTSTLFANATGSPPISRYPRTIRDFFFRANTSNDNREVEWSSQFDSNEHVPGTNQGDRQTFAEGGKITGMAGRQYAIIFQEKMIRRGIYVGPDLIFQFDPISEERGCLIPGSIASFEQTTIFASADGFYRLDGGQALTPIGDGKVDELFWDTINQDAFHAVWSVMDPRKKLYIVAWPSTGGVADQLWVYNFGTGWWAPSSYSLECLFFMYADIGFTLDSLDTIFPSIDAPGMPSLDSEFFLGDPVPKLAGFTPNHKLAFFAGDNLAATLDTPETQLGGGFGQIEIDRMIPLIDGGTPQGALGYRDRAFDPVTYSASIAADAQGDQYFSEPPARFHRARQIIPAGSTWSNALGVDFAPAQGGDA